MEHKFKPGDKAKAKKLDGAEVEILYQNGEYNVCTPNGKLSYWIHYCDLEPIPTSVDTVGEEWEAMLNKAVSIMDGARVVSTESEKPLYDAQNLIFQAMDKIESTISALRAEINELKKVSSNTDHKI